MKIFNVMIASLVLCTSMAAFGNELISKSPEGAKAYFINLQDGQVVKEDFNIQLGLKGMGISPAGLDMKNTGHHHLLIDTDVTTIDFTRSLPSTEKIMHFGKGQTETMIKLPKGKHTLQLLLGNHLHIPHNKPVMSEKITVVVK